jgi:hypothetical protein
MLAGLAINNRKVLPREAKAMLKDTVKETLQGARLMIATEESGAALSRDVAAEGAQG